MLQLKAFKFQLQNPIKWANGWAAPVYCDDRKILSYPKIRDFVRIELAHIIAEMYPDADVIAGAIKGYRRFAGNIHISANTTMNHATIRKHRGQRNRTC